jgi:hypothetical protein
MRESQSPTVSLNAGLAVCVHDVTTTKPTKGTNVMLDFFAHYWPVILFVAIGYFSIQNFSLRHQTVVPTYYRARVPNPFHCITIKEVSRLRVVWNGKETYSGIEQPCVSQNISWVGKIPFNEPGSGQMFINDRLFGVFETTTGLPESQA